MKYYVIVDETLSILEARISDMLSTGWKPQGGISVSIYPTRYNEDVRFGANIQVASLFYQAMVKGE